MRRLRLEKFSPVNRGFVLPEVVVVEALDVGLGGAQGAGQEAAADRGVRRQSDAQLPQHGQHLLLVAGPQRSTPTAAR